MTHSGTTKGLFDLTGRTALVTGGERGLGRAMAEGLAEFGSDIIINYPFPQEKARAEETAHFISGFGVKTEIIQADVSQVKEVEEMLRQIGKIFGKVDILINNAGITSTPAWIHDMEVEEWERVLGVNLRGAFLCMKYTLPLMMKQKKGSIINVSSVAALRAIDSRLVGFSLTDYSVSKAGLLALTRQAAVDYARYGIRVNAIALGHHGKTELASTWRKNWSEEMSKEYSEKILSQIPMGRRGREDEVKGLVVFLASEASSYITGQTIIQDGGLSII